MPMIKITIAGHANTGKTSIFQTFRSKTELNPDNEIGDEAGLTRKVFSIDWPEYNMRISDTPGFERAARVYVDLGEDCTWGEITAYLDEKKKESVNNRESANQDAGKKRIPWETESDTWECVIDSDVVLYVVDITIPILNPDGKFGKDQKYELDLLLKARTPIIPVFNKPRREEGYSRNWEDFFADRNFKFLILKYDAWDHDPESDVDLLKKIKLVFDGNTAKQKSVDEVIDKFGGAISDVKNAIFDHMTKYLLKLAMDSISSRESQPDLRQPLLDKIEERENLLSEKLVETCKLNLDGNGSEWIDFKVEAMVPDNKELFEHEESPFFWEWLRHAATIGHTTKSIAIYPSQKLLTLLVVRALALAVRIYLRGHGTPRWITKEVDGKEERIRKQIEVDVTEKWIPSEDIVEEFVADNLIGYAAGFSMNPISRGSPNEKLVLKGVSKLFEQAKEAFFQDA